MLSFSIALLYRCLLLPAALLLGVCASHAGLLFWSSEVGGYTSTAGVHRVDDDTGSNFTTLFSNRAKIAVDQNYLYQSNLDDGNIYRSAHDGSNNQMIVPGHSGILHLEGNSLYWYDDVAGLYRSNLDGSGVSLVTNAMSGGSGEFGGSSNYWFASTGAGNHFGREVVRYDKDGSNPTSIHPAGLPVASAGIAADDTWVYWSKWNGDVYRMRHDGTDSSMVNGASFATGLFSSGTRLYIGNRGAGTVPINVMELDGSNSQSIYSGLETRFVISIAKMSPNAAPEPASVFASLGLLSAAGCGLREWRRRKKKAV